MNIEFARPLKQMVEPASSVLGAIATEVDGGFNLDLTAEAGGSTRLVGRLKVEPEIFGSKCRFRVSYLEFVASASEIYAGGDESPFSDEEADMVLPLGQTPWSNLDELHNAAGVEVSR